MSVEKLAPKIEGEIYAPPAGTGADFSNRKTAPPLLMVRTSTARDVFPCFCYAAEHKLSMAIRGAGHSTCGRSTSPGGLLFTWQPRPDSCVLADGILTAPGGMRLLDLELFLNGQGRTLPVTPDYLGITLAGAITAGAYGITSVKRGGLVDHILSIRLLSPGGQEFVCSREENKEYFAYALAGVGGLGLIETVVLSTQPFVPDILLFTYSHPGFEDLASHILQMHKGALRIRQFDATYFNTSGKITSRYGIDKTESPPLPGKDVEKASLIENRIYHQYNLFNHQHVDAWKNHYAGCYKIWTSYMIPDNGLIAYAKMVDRLFLLPVFRNFLKCLYIISIDRSETVPAFPLEARSPGNAGRDFLVGFCFMIEEESMDFGRVPLGEIQAGCLNTCLLLGGRPYLEGSHRITPDIIEAVYKGPLEEYVRIKNRLDPENILPLKMGI